MSRKGNCMDNDAMECFFGRLKVKMVYGEKFESVEAFMQKLHEYMEQQENFPQIKRNEPGVIPNSLPNNLIKYCPNFGGHFKLPARI